MNISNSPKLVFVYLADILPEYIYYSVNFAVKNSGLDVILLTDSKSVNKKKISCDVIDISSFYDNKKFSDLEKKIQFDKNFWNGFCFKAYERFFVVAQWMEKFNINKIFLAESDNLIFDLSDIYDEMDQVCNSIYIPRDSNERSIASLIYINGSYQLEEMCNHFCNLDKLDNEMVEIAKFIDENKLAFSLPTDAIFSRYTNWDYIDYKKTLGIFDAASLGQWLFGIDGRHIIGPLYNNFINENVKYPINDILFEINGNKCYIKYLNNRYRLHNIHVHSKTHKIILKKLDYYLTNNNKKIISINIFNTFNKIVKLVFK